MNKNIYDLFAVVLHTGTLNGGHYTALAKNDKYWFEFNGFGITKKSVSK
jgi:ubiquitin C-terminal hydrolase